MTRETYFFWLWQIFLINSLPHIVFGAGCVVWARMVSQRWMRVCFTAAAAFYFALMIGRVVSLLTLDSNYVLMLSISAGHVLTHFTGAAVFALMTEAVRRTGRSSGERRRASRLLGDIIKEIRVLTQMVR